MNKNHLLVVPVAALMLAFAGGFPGSRGPKSAEAALAAVIGRPAPDLTLPDQRGRPFAFRGRVGLGPLALFFFIRNGTPG